MQINNISSSDVAFNIYNCSGVMSYPEVLVSIIEHPNPSCALNFLTAVMITKHIPIHNEPRQIFDGKFYLMGAPITFTYTYLDECETVRFSKTPAAEGVIPPLDFIDKYHDYLMPGKGTDDPDFIDLLAGEMYEEKNVDVMEFLNPTGAKSTPTTSHKAKYVIGKGCPKELLQVNNFDPTKKRTHKKIEGLNSITRKSQLSILSAIFGYIDNLESFITEEFINEVEAELAKLGFSWPTERL